MRSARIVLLIGIVLLVGLVLACGPATVPPPAPDYRLSDQPLPGQRVQAGQLFAEQMTAETAERLRIGGPHAVGGIDDWAIGNGVICGVVSDVDHEAILTAGGGILVDLGFCGRKNDQWAVVQSHMLNLSPRHIMPVENIRAEVTETDARIITTGSLEGLHSETTYRVETAVPDVLRVNARLTRREPGMRVFMVGATVLHGRRSLAPFTLSTRHPSLSVGFHHPEADPNHLSSIIRAIHPADLHVLVGSEDDAPGISYGVLAETASLVTTRGARRPLSGLALNGEHFTLQGIFARPLWFGGRDRVGLLQFAQTPLMNVHLGESLEIRYRVVVGERADAASVTDRFFAGEPVVSGRVDDPRARIHVDLRSRLRGSTPFTMVRVAPDGSFRFHAPRDRYRLTVRAPGRPPVERRFRVDSEDVDLGPIETAEPATVRLPRGRVLRLVFLGEGDTPDPSFGDDLLDFRSGSERFANSSASREVHLAGSPLDPRELTISPGSYRVLASRGLEYEVTETRIELAAGESLALEIDDPVRAFETPGWIASDLHVHSGQGFDSSFPMEAQARAFAAGGGEVLVSTEHDFVSDYAPVIERLAIDDLLVSVVGTEVTGTARTDQAPYTIGHSNVFPVELKPLEHRNGAMSAQGRRERNIVQQVRELRPHALLQLNHPRSTYPGSGDLDTGSYFTHLGVSGKPFRPDRPLDQGANRALIEPDPETGLRDLDFELIELMNGLRHLHYRRTRADWLSLLLQGEVRTGTANSDSHDAATPVAIPRTYVRMQDDRVPAFEDALFFRALRRAHVVGTSGPWLEASLEGLGPGDTYQASSGVLRVSVRSASWVDASALRVRVDAELVHESATGNGQVHEVPLAFARDAFVTVEVEGVGGELYEALAPGGVPLAFSNPIFVDADADGVWNAPGLPSRVPDVLKNPDDTP